MWYEASISVGPISIQFFNPKKKMEMNQIELSFFFFIKINI